MNTETVATPLTPLPHAQNPAGGDVWAPASDRSRSSSCVDVSTFIRTVPAGAWLWARGERQVLLKPAEGDRR